MGGDIKRGFAAMDPKKQREIASKGGKAAHEQGAAHEWTSETAKKAGRKGGKVSRGGRGRFLSTDVNNQPEEADGGNQGQAEAEETDE